MRRHFFLLTKTLYGPNYGAVGKLKLTPQHCYATRRRVFTLKKKRKKKKRNFSTNFSANLRLLFPSTSSSKAITLCYSRVRVGLNNVHNSLIYYSHTHTTAPINSKYVISVVQAWYKLSTEFEV